MPTHTTRPQSPASPPNIALIIMDTARGADTVPASPDLTPTLADLAATGTEYTRAFSSAPWTLPSHGALFTGTYSSRHGAHGGHTYLGDELDTLAEAFGDAGYETAGVSNNTWMTEEFGFTRGFETYHRAWQYIQSTTDLGEVIREKHAGGKVAAFRDRLFDGNPVVNLANAVYTEVVQPHTDDGAKRSTKWVSNWLDDRSRERPFFLYLNYIEPHLEYRPPRAVAEPFLPDGWSYEEAMAIEQDPRGYDVGAFELDDEEFAALRGLYRGELAYLDERIGALRDALVDAGEWENTIFVVASDHGENIGEHGFLGHQYNLYDTLLHVPLVIHGGPFTGGSDRSDDLVQLLDLPPTLLDAAGVEAPTMRAQFQGRSFHPDAETPPRERVVAEYVAPQPSMDALRRRFGELPDRVLEYDRSLRAIRTTEYKYIRGSDGSRELYDIRSDPGETTDLADANPERVREFDRELDAWLDSFEHADERGTVDMSASARARLEELGYLQ
ncbi:sulfatase [Haloferacaceae archaeon DSL9]